MATIDGCLNCPDSTLRFNNGNGATTCGKLNDLIVNIGTSKPEARPAKCPLPPLTGQEVSELIADRNEARSEVRALREQRDAIREKHRVEIATLNERLEKTELERDHARTANGWEEWKRATLEALDSMKSTRDAATARADLAEKRLAALLEAAEGVLKYRPHPLGAWGTLLDTIQAVRGGSAVPSSDATTKLAALVEAVASSMSSIQADCHPTIINRLSDALEAARGES